MHSPLCILARTNTPTAVTRSRGRPPPHSHRLLAGHRPLPASTRWSSMPPPRLPLHARQSLHSLQPRWIAQQRARFPGLLQRRAGGTDVWRGAEAVCQGATPSLHQDTAKQVRGDTHLACDCITNCTRLDKSL